MAHQDISVGHSQPCTASLSPWFGLVKALQMDLLIRPQLSPLHRSVPVALHRHLDLSVPLPHLHLYKKPEILILNDILIGYILCEREHPKPQKKS